MHYLTIEQRETLQANPLATRCTACQTTYEHTHVSPGRSKI